MEGNNNDDGRPHKWQKWEERYKDHDGMILGFGVSNNNNGNKQSTSSWDSVQAKNK